MSGNIRLYNTSGYVELQAPSSATNQTLVLPTDSIQPGLVHLHTETFSAVSSVSINNVFSVNYDAYKVIVSDYLPSVSGSDTRWRMRSASTDETSSNYWYAGILLNTNGTLGAYTSGGNPTTTGFIGNTSAISGFGSFTLEFINPFETIATRCSSHAFGYSGNNRAAWVESSLNTVTSYDGLTIYPATGTISGTIRIYGYRNA